MYSLISKFEETGSVLDDRAGKAGPSVIARTKENTEGVRNIIENQPSTSIRRVAQQMGISVGTTWTILRRDLDQFPTKFNFINN